MFDPKHHVKKIESCMFYAYFIGWVEYISILKNVIFMHEKNIYLTYTSSFSDF